MVLCAQSTLKLLIFLLAASLITQATAGAVVSNPTPQNITFLSGFFPKTLWCFVTPIARRRFTAIAAVLADLHFKLCDIFLKNINPLNKHFKEPPGGFFTLYVDRMKLFSCYLKRHENKIQS
jgi:hypothetical protein